jgi:hypothetical protein
LREGFFDELALSNISADGEVLARAAILIEKRDDCGCFPIERTVFGPVPNLAFPNLAAADRFPHVLEKSAVMVARIDDAMIVAEQFLAGIFADFAKTIVDVSDLSLGIGGVDRRVVVEGRSEFFQFIEQQIAGPF